MNTLLDNIPRRLAETSLTKVRHSRSPPGQRASVKLSGCYHVSPPSSYNCAGLQSITHKQKKKSEKVALPLFVLVLAMLSPFFCRVPSWSSACIVTADSQQVGQTEHRESTGLLT